MPGQNLMQSVGGQAQKPTRFVSLFTSRFFNGLFTNRSLLRGPLGFLYTDFYHAGTTDVLCDGLNSELYTHLSMIRRPGNPKYSTAQTDSAVDNFYSFHHSDGTIQVVVDTALDVDIYTPSSNTNIWNKTSGAGEGYFQGINQSLYIADGIDLVKYIPGTTNPFATSGSAAGQSVWKWGGAAPTTAPSTVITQTGSAGIAWAAATMFTTMGLLVDNNSNIQFLVSTMQNGNTTQFGTTGSGNPNWNNAFGATTIDNTVTWTSKGQLGVWTAGTTYAAFAPIYDPVSNGIYVNFFGGQSGSARPIFKPIFNTHTNDKTSQWQYIGPPALWKPSTTYNSFWEFSQEMICEPVIGNSPAAMIAILNAGTQPIYVQTANDASVGSVNNPGTSGSNYTPPWQTTAGLVTSDGQLLWSCLGSKNWGAFKAYSAWFQGSTSFSVLVDSNNNFQVCSTTGSSQGTIPYPSWQASHSFAGGSVIAVQNPLSATGFTAFQSGGAGTSGATEPTWNFSFPVTDSGVTWTPIGATTAGRPVWGTTYGSTTADGTATWVNVGSSANSFWVKNTSWYLPASGFAVPSGGQPYGGASVVGSAWNQFVTASGLSGGSPPSWGTSVGTTATDNTITWTATSAFGAVGFTWTKGYGYVYCFKARAANDPDVTTSPALSVAGTNSPNPIGPLGLPFGAQDNTVTSASPVGFFVGAQATGAQITVSGPGSTDPQFDTVMVFRCVDGFQTSGPYLLLTELNMPPLTSGGTPGQWSVIDFMPDTPTTTLQGLNELIVAPINRINDPPPGQFGSLFFTQSSPSTPQVAAASTAMIGTEFHQGRLWGFIGNNVYASGGPDTLVGNGFTAWPPTNVFPFQSQVTRVASTTGGLLVYTTTGLYIIAGGPAITTYYSQLLVPALGLLSWNAFALMSGIPHIFSSDRQLLGIQPGVGITRVGHPIGDILAKFNPANVYLTYHSFGDLDHALFIADGVGTWYRCDTNLAPDSSYVGPVWSPAATIAGGFKAIASVETSPGTSQLLIGPTAAGNILARDSTFSIFSDKGAVGTGVGGSAYSSFFTIGNLVFATPGQMAELGFVEMDLMKVGSQPTVQVLLDEIAATAAVPFETISNYFVSDPPKLYGPTNLPQTLFMNRYYFGQTTPLNAGQQPMPAWCKYMQLKVDFGATDTVMNELLAFTVFGALWQER